MKHLKLTIIVLALLLMSWQVSFSQELRPSISFDMNMGLDNSDFRQGCPGETQVGYGYQHISMLLELPASDYTMIRFGLERIEHSFEQRNDNPGFYNRDLMYATYNIRLGVKFYLDKK